MQRILKSLATLTAALWVAGCSGGSHTLPASAPANPSTQTVLTASHVREYAIPYLPQGVAVAPNGTTSNVWSTGQNSVGAAVGFITPNPGTSTLQNYSFGNLPANEANQFGSVPGMAAAPDGSVWFTVINRCQNGQIEAVDHSTTSATSSASIEYPLGPQYDCPFMHSIALGSDGNLWATADGNPTTTPGEILKFVPGMTSGPVASYATPFQPGPITAGPDGALWFLSSGANGATGGSTNEIGRIDTSGNITVVANLPAADFRDITSAAGAVWVLDAYRNVVARFSTSGAEIDYPIPTPNAVHNDQFGNVISSGNGYVYFAETTPEEGLPGRIGQLNTTTGAILEYMVPCSTGDVNPRVIAQDAQGNVWIGAFSVDELVEATLP